MGPRKNRAERVILDRPGAMPVQDYKTMAVVMKGFGKGDSARPVRFRP
jgi:hypothetical protein